MDMGRVSAVVFAAGQSKRMGRPKLLLPWGDTVVIGQVVLTLAQAGLVEIIVVTGALGGEIEGALAGLPVRLIQNPRYEVGEMLSSAQAGLAVLGPQVEAALFVLGDQPQIQAGVIQAVLAEYHRSHAPLVVPSYRMRRGHPWCLARSLWPAVHQLGQPASLRDLLHAHAGQIDYVPVDTPTILQDLDTPQDYARLRTGAPDVPKAQN